MRDGSTNEVECYEHEEEYCKCSFDSKYVLFADIRLVIIRESPSEEAYKSKEYKIYQNTVPYNSKCRNKEKESIYIEHDNHVSEVLIFLIITSEKVYHRYKYKVQYKKDSISVEKWVLCINL